MPNELGHRDELDQILRSKFSGSNLDSFDIPEPSESVWDNIEQSIAPTKKDNRKSFWLFSFLLFGLISFSSMYYFYNRNEDKTSLSKITPNTESTDDQFQFVSNESEPKKATQGQFSMGARDADLKETNIETDRLITSEEIIKDNFLTNIESKTNTDATVKNQDVTPSDLGSSSLSNVGNEVGNDIVKETVPKDYMNNSLSANITSNDSNDQITNDLENSKRRSAQDIVSVEKIEEKEEVFTNQSIAFNKIPFLKFNSLPTKLPAPIPLEKVIQTPNKKGPSPRVALKVSGRRGAVFASTNYNYSVNNIDQSFSVNGSDVTGGQIEAQVDLNDDWRVIASLGVTNVHFTGSYELNGSYDITRDISATKSTVSATFPSYSGPIKANIIFDKLATSIDQGSVVANELDLAHGVKSISVLGGVSKKIWSSNQLKLYTGVTGGMSIRNQGLETFDGTIRSQSGEFGNSTFEIVSVSGNEVLERKIIQGSFNASLEYQLTPSLGVTIDAVYTNFFNPQVSDAPFNIQLSTLSGGVGLRYRL